MAEEEKKYTYTTRGRWAGGIISTLKTAANVLGGRFHYSRTAYLDLVPRKKLKDAIDLLGRRIEELNEVETQYGYVGKNYVEKTIRKEVEDIYYKLGFYSDVSLIDKERKLFGGGTGVKEEEIEIDGKHLKFPIPDEKELTFPDGYVERVSYFGYNQKITWQGRYTKFIEKVCKEKVEKINKDKNLNPEQKSNMIDVVNKVIKRSYLTILPQLFAGLPIKTKEGEIPPKGVSEGIDENIPAKEKDGESFIYHLKERHAKRLANLRAELYKNMPLKVRYKHTYKVVDLNKIRDEKKLWEEEKDTEEVKKRKREMWEEKKKKWVDENGKPLEVATKGYKFEGRTYNEGDVLLDIFNGRSPRNVPKKYIVDLPLIEVVNYVHCEWDEYRDDLRDGRYHPESLTVMDYIMAANSSIGGEWKRKIRNPLAIGQEYRKYKMKLGDGRVITNNRIPSNLSPAFDLRAFSLKGGEYWQLVGKKKYYEHADNICVKEQKDPHITTRGLSMFIIETICRQGKSLKEIDEELKDVGKQTGGFDYGPRPFGGAFCKDPFSIDISAANESVKPKEG